MYEQQGVQYYVIADPEFRKIEINKLEEGTYRLLTTDSLLVEFVFDACKTRVDFANTWL